MDSIGSLLAFFIPKLQGFFWNRGLKNGQNFNQLVSSRGQETYLFFCSSAGEDEQGLPLARKLESGGGAVVICFFSRSGYDFAKARGEKRY